MIKSTANNSLILNISRPVRVFIRRFSFALLIILALVAIYISKDESSTSLAVRKYVVDASAPVVSVVAVPFNFFTNISNSVQSYFFVHSKNELLAKENNELRKRVINLTGAAFENESLKSLLNYVKESDYSHISAKVMGSASDPYSNSVIINAGAKDGVRKGQAVINEYGLVGRITEIYDENSRVLLLSDINSNIPIITYQSRERGVLSGNSTSTPDVIYLPVISHVENGEVIITSGDGSVFPEGLQVGIIYKDDNNRYSASPFVDFKRLEFVSVVDIKKQENE